MTISLPYPTLKNLLVVIIIMMANNNYTLGQIGLSSAVKTNFLKDSVQVSDNSFYFNSLSVTNFSPKPVQLEIAFDVPCFTSLISIRKQVIEAGPGQTLVLPVRFSGNNKTSCSLSWQPVHCIITD